MQKLISFLKVYGVFTAIIVGWWVLAFKSKPKVVTLAAEVHVEMKSKSHPLFPSNFIYVQREDLKRALAGDFALMTKLIVDWDIDAQLLHAAGVSSIRRLAPTKFLESQMLSRVISNGNSEEAERVRADYSIKYAVDDIGSRIHIKKHFKRFLPQTYAAASFLLALVPTENIIALPRRLREQVQLYSKRVTDNIPLDIDRYNGEKLFQAKPEVAFIAHYSHPTTIQALSNQSILLYVMKDFNTLNDIMDELLVVGSIINRPLEAQLLAIFMNAAMIAIDNKLTIITQNYERIRSRPAKVLFLNHHNAYTIPTPRTLTGRLLERMGDWDISLKYVADSDQNDVWAMPIDKERLLKLDPDCLIIATENRKALESEIRDDPAMSQLSAVRNHNLYFVDEAVQQSPSQYIVLAYYDLIQTLAALP